VPGFCWTLGDEDCQEKLPRKMGTRDLMQEVLNILPPSNPIHLR